MDRLKYRRCLIGLQAYVWKTCSLMSRLHWKASNLKWRPTGSSAIGCRLAVDSPVSMGPDCFVVTGELRIRNVCLQAINSSRFDVIESEMWAMLTSVSRRNGTSNYITGQQFIVAQIEIGNENVRWCRCSGGLPNVLLDLEWCTAPAENRRKL